MGDLIDETSGKAKVINKFSYVFWVLIGITAISIVFLVLSSFDFTNDQTVFCGDLSFYETCSLNKPYYCNWDGLTYRPDLCGCPEVLTKEEGICTDDFYGQQVELSLKYVLDGQIKYLTIPFYTNLSSYLSQLPREIVYYEGEVPQRSDFKLIKMDNPLQREALMPLVVAIQNTAPNSFEDQARIAVSLVQHIPYGEPEFQDTRFGKIRLARYPYEVIDQYLGSCEGKSELMAFLLRELGYGVSLFYYAAENHEAVGISCPEKYSLNNSGYCFIETTVPAPISYSTGTYLGILGGKLRSNPQIVLISPGKSLSSGIDDYSDAKKLSNILDDGDSTINPLEKNTLDDLRVKYDLSY